MKNRWIAITLSLLTGLATVALAQGIDSRGGHMDARMKKFHAMMPMFSVASAKLETALDNGDTAAVEAEAGKMLAATPDLKKSKPHKNVKQRKEFVGLATDFEKTVASTRDLAGKGDFAGAKNAFKKAEEVCVACHAKFRD